MINVFRNIFFIPSSGEAASFSNIDVVRKPEKKLDGTKNINVIKKEIVNKRAMVLRPAAVEQAKREVMEKGIKTEDPEKKVLSKKMEKRKRHVEGLRKLLDFEDEGGRKSLDNDSPVMLESKVKGRYLLVFPGFGKNGSQTASFRVHYDKIDGKNLLQLEFDDPLLKGGEIDVKPEDFKKMVNNLYLEHVMTESLGVYDPVGLNSLIHDRSMFKLAKGLFSGIGVNMLEKNISRENAEVFRRLMLVILNKSNSTGKEGSNRDLLLSYEGRVRLLKDFLDPRYNKSLTTVYKYLKELTPEELTNLSVAKMFDKFGFRVGKEKGAVEGNSALA